MPRCIVKSLTGFELVTNFFEKPYFTRALEKVFVGSG